MVIVNSKRAESRGGETSSVFLGSRDLENTLNTLRHKFIIKPVKKAAISLFTCTPSGGIFPLGRHPPFGCLTTCVASLFSHTIYSDVAPPEKIRAVF